MEKEMNKNQNTILEYRDTSENLSDNGKSLEDEGASENLNGLEKSLEDEDASLNHNDNGDVFENGEVWENLSGNGLEEFEDEDATKNQSADRKRSFEDEDELINTKILKRQNYLSWSDTFMAIAQVVALRSKDPNTQVGAVIVNDEGRVVSVGYNGMPNGCSDDRFPWSKGGGPYQDKHLYVCHAETNAIHNRNSASLKGCTMYVTLFPCNECTKHIIQSGIAHIIFLLSKKEWSSKAVAARRMLDAASVTYTRFVPSSSTFRPIVIDLQGRSLPST